GARGSAKKAAELLGIENFFLRNGRRVEPLSPHCGDYSLFRTFRLPDGEERFIFGWGVNCFSQVNDAQNERLIRLVAELVGDPWGMRVLDLYCGAGNFSLPLAVQGARGIGIEQNSEAIAWARRNSSDNGIRGWEFIVADVEKALVDLSERGEVFDTVLLDPPRRGMGKASELLPRLARRNIIYISCDPATMARDLKILQSMGTRLISLTPVDMFPQTHHIESVALLEKN
ncbi:MAG: methyltransferase domain-containing protein, partial [Desulfobulbaceae bacterium]|nr:methyltransferase domain-containing protein [Desulfobulbaceae bacterium]